MKRIALLTSSRADYSIYYPLISKFKSSKEFELDIIAFGNHNSLLYGNSAKRIEEDGFEIKHKIDGLVLGDTAESISDSMGLTIIKFSSIWKFGKYDLIVCLGDRFEMFSAVAASIPFNIPIAHISGGEITLGAIDNVFRYSLTLMSKFHFVSTEQYKRQVINLIGIENKNNVFNYGALSIDNLRKMHFLSINDFKDRFDIDLDKKSVLITFHPETVSIQKIERHIHELLLALKRLSKYQLIITMPNTDTMGNMIREKLMDFIRTNKNAVGVESFGTIGYLTCMKYCEFMLGNTSSGFVEASFFPKYVINLGDRQKGRIITPNILNSEITENSILRAVSKIEGSPDLEEINIYGDGDTAEKIFETLKMKLTVK